MAQEETHQAGTIIFTEDSKAENIYILLEGLVNIECAFKQGLGTISIYRVKEGEIFGWSGLVEPYLYYTASAKYVERSRVIAIGEEDLSKIFEKNNHLVLQITMMAAATASSRPTHTKDKILDFI